MAERPNTTPVHGIRPPPPLSIEHNVSDNWKQKWKIYSVSTNLERQDNQYQVALLLHTLGDEALKVYNGFHFNVDEENRTVEEIISKFDAFTVGEVNETYERFIFNNRDQKEGETFESFHAAIRSLAKTCNYCDACINSILRERIIIGIRDATIQTTLLKELTLTL